MAIDLKELERVARDIGHRIGDRIADEGHGKKIGFTLLIFDFGGGGNITYIPNANREDMKRAMREMLLKLEAH